MDNPSIAPQHSYRSVALPIRHTAAPSPPKPSRKSMALGIEFQTTNVVIWRGSMDQRLSWVVLSFGAGFRILSMMPKTTTPTATIPILIRNSLSPKNA